MDRPDPLERLALGNAQFDGQLHPQLSEWIEVCRADGSDSPGEILDFLPADERPHVRNGKRWIVDRRCGRKERSESARIGS